MAEPLRIRLRPDWDAALTYESLHEEPENRPVFVGREVLIAPLVAEIIEPNKRGTYLISGYRGTGKTTLLIEALSQAKTRFKDKRFGSFHSCSMFQRFQRHSVIFLPTRQTS